MYSLIKSIDQLQHSIFECRLADIPVCFQELVNELEIFTPLIPSSLQPVYNQILFYMMKAYEYQDYLLLADISEFELKPLARQVTDGEGQ